MASVRARDTFHALGRLIAHGEVIDASDPIVKGREALFEPADDSTVEQATAAPGEKRSTPAKKAPAKKKAAPRRAAAAKSED